MMGSSLRDHRTGRAKRERGFVANRVDRRVEKRTGEHKALERSARQSSKRELRAGSFA